MAFFTYILASGRNGTLYVGSTDNLPGRIWDHKTNRRPGFTATYSVHALVWFEAHATRDDAFRRERRLKKWRRVLKLDLIERTNPSWRDLYEEWLD